MAQAPTDAVVGEFLSGHAHESALTTTTAWQRLKIAFWLIHLVVLFVYDWKIFFTMVTGILCVFYLFTILYKLLTVLLSVIAPGDMRITKDEIEALEDETLPVYTLLLPAYKEAAVVEKLLRAVTSFDYPADKLDVILLLEEDDKETQGLVEGVELPECVRVLVVPDGKPKTKPRACMHGLKIARGEYLVIYDAEDRPEPDQLKKAVAAFRKVPPRVTCLQAKLNYYNPRQNWLTKWFTLEYTTWFDLFLPGLNRLGVPIPLGGTSNHFRTEELREVGGWDPFNVAEDCDLGMRLHKSGYRTRILDSTTWEEANSSLGNWIRQRSRWVKGYVQTHLVHTREALSGVRILLTAALGAWMFFGLGRVALHLINFIGTRSDASKNAATQDVVTELTVAVAAGLAIWLVGCLKRSFKFGVGGQASFLLTVGGLSLTLLLNPIFWGVGIAWLGIRASEVLSEVPPDKFLWPIWYDTSYYDESQRFLNYWSVASHWFWGISVVLLVSNAVLIAVHLLACARRNLKDLVHYALFVPIYWILISIGAWHGTLQLLTRAHYWEKTVHGLGPAGAEPEPPPAPGSCAAEAPPESDAEPVGSGALAKGPEAATDGGGPDGADEG
ncbi:MAG: glycosyltransferase [Planctomycetota bacterium]|jgi:cellulose synthase/poly-beta-1,6-N-acetylglucosamine synthase-like glycosyltransferase